MIKIIDEKDEPPFPFQNSDYQDKITKEVAKVIDVGRKRNRHFIFVVPNKDLHNRAKR